MNICKKKIEDNRVSLHMGPPKHLVQIRIIIYMLQLITEAFTTKFYDQLNY